MEKIDYDYRLVIDMKLPSLNDYVNTCRTNRFKAAKYKASIETEIGQFLTKMPRWDNPIQIRFIWLEGAKRRDLDNIAFAKKFILDAMVKYNKLKDDNRKCVIAFRDDFGYTLDKTYKVILEIKEIKENAF